MPASYLPSATGFQGRSLLKHVTLSDLVSSRLVPVHAQISIWRQCQASPYVCKLEEVFQVGWQGAGGQEWGG